MSATAAAPMSTILPVVPWQMTFVPSVTAAPTLSGRTDPALSMRTWTRRVGPVSDEGTSSRATATRWSSAAAVTAVTVSLSAPNLRSWPKAIVSAAVVLNDG